MWNLLNCVFLLRFRFYFVERGEGGRKRRRETSMWERYIHLLPLPHPQPGSQPAAQACALTRIKPTTPNPRSHTGQAGLNQLKNSCKFDTTFQHILWCAYHKKPSFFVPGTVTRTCDSATHFYLLALARSHLRSGSNVPSLFLGVESKSGETELIKDKQVDHLKVTDIHFIS